MTIRRKAAYYQCIANLRDPRAVSSGNDRRTAPKAVACGPQQVQVHAVSGEIQAWLVQT